MQKSSIQRTIESTPAVVAIEETYDPTISSSAEITLNSATTLIVVSVFTKPVVLKWGTTDASLTDFDEVVVANESRQFFVPIDTSTGKLFTAVNFIEQAATAILFVVEK